MSVFAHLDRARGDGVVLCELTAHPVGMSQVIDHVEVVGEESGAELRVVVYAAAASNCV